MLALGDFLLGALAWMLYLFRHKGLVENMAGMTRDSLRSEAMLPSLLP
jgi:hypothetical protein